MITPVLVTAASASTQATSPRASSRSTASRSLYWTSRTLRVASAGTPSPSGTTRALVKHAEQLVGVAVVLAVEHQHGAAARRGAGHANRLGVRLGGRERELPRGQSESRGESGRSLHAVLGRQQELGTGRHPLAHGARDRLPAVAREHARVREIEVEVGVAVDVREASTAAALDHDRRMLVERGHPGLRHAVRHVRRGALEQLHAARAQLGEACQLALAQSGELLAPDLAHRPLTWRHDTSGRRSELGQRGRGIVTRSSPR